MVANEQMDGSTHPSPRERGGNSTVRQKTQKGADFPIPTAVPAAFGDGRDPTGPSLLSSH